MDREECKIFYGIYSNEIKKLSNQGFVPMNTSQLMKKRLEFANSSEKVEQNLWIRNFFDTGDAIIYHPNGDLKIVLDSKNLIGQQNECQDNFGVLIVNENLYHDLPGQVFKKNEFRLTEESLSKSEVKSHPVWNFLARDQKLLNDYTDFVFDIAGKNFDKDDTMKTFLEYSSRNRYEMGAWLFGGVFNGSNLYGSCSLTKYYSRIAGVTPEKKSSQEVVCGSFLRNSGIDGLVGKIDNSSSKKIGKVSCLFSKN